MYFLLDAQKVTAIIKDQNTSKKNKETAKFEKIKSAKIFKPPRLEKSNVSSNPVTTFPASTGHNKTRDKCSETNLQSASTSLAQV